MGTNYYLHKDVCLCCNRAAEIAHIGKSSGGWCFLLHCDPQGDVESIPRDLAGCIFKWSQPNCKILDEDQVQVPPEEMLEIIADRRGTPKILHGYKNWEQFHAENDSQDGPRCLLRHRLDPRFCYAHGDGTYDLVTGEFS